jgi:hypothetical protein
MSNFYEFNQNNSGGNFVTTDKLCHRVVIQADSYDEARTKALDMGIYFDGAGDCPCCGDRWHDYEATINVNEINVEGYQVTSYNSEADWLARYGKFIIHVFPEYVYRYGSGRWEGRIRFLDLEDYLQFQANEYGWTKPDARVFYKDGQVSEIYSTKPR